MASRKPCNKGPSNTSKTAVFGRDPMGPMDVFQDVHMFFTVHMSAEVLRMLRENTELSEKLSAQREALEVKLAEDKRSVGVVDAKLQTLPTAQPNLAFAGVVPT